MAITKLLQHWPCMSILKNACFMCLRIQNRLLLHQTSRRYLLKELNYGTVIPCKGYHSLTLYLPRVISECSIHLYGKRENMELKDKKIDEKYLLDQLCCLYSTKQILQLLDTAEHISDRLAAEALLKIAEVESKNGNLFSHSELFKNKTFQAILVQFEQECQKLSTSSLVNALKAFVQLGMNIRSTSLSCFLHECQERVFNGQMTIENLCVLGKCLSSIESDSTMLESIMNHVQMKEVERWTSEEIVMVYSLLPAISFNGLQYQSLLDKMHTVATLVSTQLSPKQISSVLYSLVKLQQTEAMGLIINLCRRSVKYIPAFTDEELSNVLAALNELSCCDPDLTEALEKRVSETAFTMSPEAVTQVMQYCSKNRILSKPIFNAVAESFVYNSENFTTYEITAQVTPFGKLNYLPPNASDLFRRLERVMSNRFSQFQPQTLLNLLHSCTLIQRFPVNFFEKVFSPYFIQQLQDQNGNIDPCVLSQLAQLYLTVNLECPFYKGPKLFPKYRLKSLSTSGCSIETKVDQIMYKKVKKGLIGLLGEKLYFASQVLSPQGYILDIEIGLDENGFVLPHCILKKSSKRIALCIDDEKRFCSNSNNLLGKECIKQRHLKLLGYHVVQIPFYEIHNLHIDEEIVEYLHKKIFPHSYRMKW
ncbi:FAST kinase domain-containing protein 3, mitochondrial [Hyla sarda]|uniref:FAST kinase domain-containing protein 3, mitochondrial n=1 Tax=Hyla sarda TaxID=327740 RepID=UPI0024C2347D|nr:FAST kinase domain-containing protein 3, mitochondrial [Hyla sarda]XP_056376694.1 FAST kinase domain-containing protein 3, mitochondrial [Hyla sarda]XP_056376695.1 FAST kinase domain-containing protein 3, mitochondrial [Hyla sarda]XP_056376696.1 FAST kinase domain-containing protein 3, mitochondrial [Hyla sarda]